MPATLTACQRIKLTCDIKKKKENNWKTEKYTNNKKQIQEQTQVTRGHPSESRTLVLFFLPCQSEYRDSGSFAAAYLLFNLIKYIYI